MIRIVEADITTATEEIIIHQVNCQGVMGSGVAAAIKKKWPAVYDDYMTTYKNCVKKEDLLGSVSYVRLGYRKYVVNMFSQLTYGYNGDRHTNYEAFYCGLEKIANQFYDDRPKIAIPFNIGCDRGGASWNIIYYMIAVAFQKYDVTIYKYNPMEETK